MCYSYHHHHQQQHNGFCLRVIWLFKSVHCCHQGSDGSMQSVYCSCLLSAILLIQHPPPSVHSNPDLYFRLSDNANDRCIKRTQLLTRSRLNGGYFCKVWYVHADLFPILNYNYILIMKITNKMQLYRLIHYS